jgi:type IX secretion system PorP/SprF family membrane protein
MILPLAANAQQMPLYSQYVMNGYMLNPAITGHDGYTSFNLTARQQWLGIKNAPATRSFSGQTRLLKRSHVIKQKSINNRSLKPSTSGRVGLGGFVYNDRNGAVERTGLQASYAYHIFVKETQFSFGLSAGVFQFKIADDLTFYDQLTGQGDDPLASNLKKVSYVPDANLGFYVSDPRFYGGISVNQLFQSYLRIGNRQFEEYKMVRHYYLLGGYRFALNNSFNLEPNALFKATERKVFQLDLGLRLDYNNDYWLGILYRTGGSLIFQAGVRVSQLYIGYAFDYSLAAIQKHTYGSHELVLALKLGDNARRYRWLIRY